MNAIANSVIRKAPEPRGELEARIFRSMIFAVSVSVVAAALFAPWRVATGLLLGGALSLINYRWLNASVAAVLSLQTPGSKPRTRVWRHFFRYLAIGGAVFAAYKLQMVSLPAAIAGLCSFVFALFVEAFRQFYFAIIRREEPF